MSKQQLWKQGLIAKLEQKYGVFSTAQKTEIEGLLDNHWDLCRTHAAQVFAELPAIGIGIGVLGIIDLTVFPAAGHLVAAIGRPAYMALSYFAIDLLSIEVFKKIGPSLNMLETLENKHIEALFKKADNIEDLARVLKNINTQINSTIETAKHDHVIAALGAGVGAGVGGLIKGGQRAGAIGTLATIASHSAYKLFGKDNVYRPVPSWQDTLDQPNDAKEVRQRPPQSSRS